MRAPINERKEFKSIGLPPRLWEFAKTVGQGQYANGIRYIVEIAYKQERLQEEDSPNQCGTGSQRTTD